jgi:hypothetical protein
MPVIQLKELIPREIAHWRKKRVGTCIRKGGQEIAIEVHTISEYLDDPLAL